MSVIEYLKDVKTIITILIMATALSCIVYIAITTVRLIPYIIAIILVHIYNIISSI